MARLGVLTIGQSPRTELTADLQRWLPPGTDVVDRGVLDGLSRAEVLALAPVPGRPEDTDVLTTSLPDGTTVVLAERHVVHRLPAALAALERSVDVLFLACTGTFPELPHRRPLVVPENLVTTAVAGLSAGMPAVGVVCPLPEQVEPTRRKFAAALPTGARLHVRDCSPYTGTAEELTVVAEELAAEGAELIALDCMGYTDATRAVVTRAAGVPVVVSRSVAARLTAELLDSCAASGSTSSNVR